MRAFLALQQIGPTALEAHLIRPNSSTAQLPGRTLTIQEIDTDDLSYDLTSRGTELLAREEARR